MGSSQTKVSPDAATHDKPAIERLRELQPQSKDVGVRGIAGVMLARETRDISVSQMQEWQNRLLEDPKNRHVAAAKRRRRIHG